MKELFNNLNLLMTVQSNPSIGILVSLLKNITKNNPWCQAVDKFLRSGNQFKNESFGYLPIDQNLLKNLPLMLIDLKEYLITQREDHLAKTRGAYLQKSIDYLKAGERLRTTVMKLTPAEAVAGRVSSIAADISSGGLCNLIKVTQHTKGQTLKAMRLEAVDGYWIEASEMVTKFVEELSNPSEVKPGLVKKYNEARRITKIAKVID